jgi:hypothetical protein
MLPMLTLLHAAQRQPRTRAGLPNAVAPTVTSRVTILPAPITALSPIDTPGRMIAPPPIQTLLSDADRATKL